MSVTLRTIAWFLVGVFVRFSTLTQRLCRRDSLTEISHDLLGRLRMQVGALSLDILLQLGFGRPLSALLTCCCMAFDKPGPQPTSLKTCCCERLPLRPRLLWEPVYFYRAITHALSIVHRGRIGNTKPLFTRAHPLAPPRTPPVSPRPPGATPRRASAGTASQRWTPQARAAGHGQDGGRVVS